MALRVGILCYLLLLAAAFTGQGYVLRARRALRRPQAALRAWAALLLLLTLLLLLPGSTLLALGTGGIGGDWVSFLCVIGGWVLLTVAGGFMAAVIAAAERLEASAARQRAGLQARSGAPVLVQGHVVRRYEDPLPLAVALRRRPPTVILSSGLLSTLDGAPLDAVLQHELAHLRRGHPRALRLSEVIDALFPGPLRRTRATPARPVRLLVELAADDDAAAAVGAGPLAEALASLHAATGDAAYLARLQRLRALTQPQTR